MFPRIPFARINWQTSIFLIGTFVLTLTAVPAYIWRFGLDWFQVAFFFVMYACTGLSITLGYHRLFAHIAFKAHWLVRLFTLLFGAAAFENSALLWASEHRRHHKHVDHDEDPYDITKGFFHAHIGWLLFKIQPDGPFDNVADLQRDRLVSWQHRWIHPLAFTMSFVMPALVGWAWGGPVAALGSFLIAGVARVVCVQHSTFCINSMCHTVGKRPYSTRCTARDSWLMALVTFGEGYHNYHHEFQHDYRNGVKPWQFDPTKWTIWALDKLGLANGLRRVPSEKILLAELAETQRQLHSRLSAVEPTSETHSVLAGIYERVQEIAQRFASYRDEKIEVTREMLIELRNELRAVMNAVKLLGASTA
jgi:stearoyl-CoA desaturase (Delta-9 desaturase)